jgi:hypothetical protein
VRVWEKIPPKWKAKCKLPPSDCVKVDQWKTDAIIVPKIVLAQLDVWGNDPSSILSSEAASSLNPSQDFVGRLYLALEHAHIQLPIMEAIRSRILQTTLYGLVNRLGVCQLHENSEAETEFFSRLKVREDDIQLRKRCKLG